MSPTAAALLLFALLLGESFAGYSTGFRRTPKPKNPGVPSKPVVFPSHHGKEHQHWVGQGGISSEEGKIDGGAGGNVGDGGIGIGVGGGAGKVPNEGAETGSHIGSGHWVPSPEVPSTGGKEEPHNVPKLPHQEEDTSVKLDDKNVKEEIPEVPHPPEEIPPSEGKEQPLKPDVDGSIDLPGKPDAPETNGDLPDVPHIPEIPPDEPLKEDEPVVPNAGADYDDKEPNGPLPDVPPGDVAVIPPGVNTDTGGSDDDEKVPQIPADDSHEIPPDSHPGDGDISVVVPGGGTDEDYEGPDEKIPPVSGEEGGVGVEGPDEKIPPVSGEEGGVGVGPLPNGEVPPIDTPVIPYPIKVGNGNINLYELMEKLELSRFLHLIEEANLKDLLTGEGPITIFAPSDYALSKLDANTIRTLATNQELLRQFVLYHLVDGQIYGPTFDERDNSVIVTKFDRAIHINRYGTIWYVNGIPITTRDQVCRNGVIHILDGSLYPFPTGNLMETLDGLNDFKIYTELVRNAKLDRELKGNVVYTIFVPTDEAFSKLPPANLEWLKWDIPAIKRMFRQLTVNGMYYTTWIPSGDGQLTSLDEQTKLSLSGYPDDISVNGVRLSQYDITASNGCIHTIDDIWFLSELGTPSSSPSKKKD